jgi:hypothetical protein
LGYYATPEEYEVACSIAGLANEYVGAAGATSLKCGSNSFDCAEASNAKVANPSQEETMVGLLEAKTNNVQTTSPAAASEVVFKPLLKPSPYFYYTDHSQEGDSDPPTSLAEPGQPLSFPVKMHAMLSNPIYNRIVSWDNHGRSFKVHNPHEFEFTLLPKFFEHSKMSSFLRLLNGWGFRPLKSNSNPNKNMPWLCKKMRRPSIGQKFHITPAYHPDLVAINSECPLPNYPVSREIQLVNLVVEQGPRARMPSSLSLLSSPRPQNIIGARSNEPLSEFASKTDEDFKPAALTDAAITYPNEQVRVTRSFQCDYADSAAAMYRAVSIEELEAAVENAKNIIIKSGMMYKYPTMSIASKFRKEVKSSMILQALQKYHGHHNGNGASGAAQSNQDCQVAPGERSGGNAVFDFQMIMLTASEQNNQWNGVTCQGPPKKRYKHLSFFDERSGR